MKTTAALCAMIALASLCVLSCDATSSIGLGKSVSGTITRDSDVYEDVEEGYRCYINRYTIDVTGGREYTLRLWSDNGCVFETPDDNGEFSEGDLHSYGLFSTGDGETSIARWVPRAGGSMRVNIYSTTVPTDYEFTVSD